jgi:hypothetical protein
VSANAAGSFITDKLVVPHESGTKTYTFVGQQSGSSFTVSVKISDTDPWITLNTYYAGAGTALTINGHAFGSGETISIRFGGIVVGIAVANQNGNFTFTTKVPAMGAGEKVVHVQGEVSGKYDTEIFSQAF